MLLQGIVDVLQSNLAKVASLVTDATAQHSCNTLSVSASPCLYLQKQWLAMQWLLTCLCLHLQASIVDVLQSDLAKIESLVRDAMRQLSSAATSSVFSFFMPIASEATVC